MDNLVSPFDFNDDQGTFETTPFTTTGEFKAKPGIYFDLTNEQYHNSDGISKSGLDLVAECEGDYIWSKSAPVDETAIKHFDIGTAFHCIIGEPDEYDSRYIVAPEVNRRTTKGKEDEKAFIEEVKNEGKIILTFEDNQKLHMMRESCYAHPVARFLLEAEGVSEASIYWTDKETGELHRIRPDKYIQIQGQHIIVDYKSIAGIDRMPAHVEEYRYHVQDAMYSEGYFNHFGERADFIFLFCSSTLNCGKYPVTCRQLSSEWKDAGYNLYREAAHKYHQAKVNDDWLSIPTLQRPRWAK